jgi:hypothetical protein
MEKIQISTVVHAILENMVLQDIEEPDVENGQMRTLQRL